MKFEAEGLEFAKNLRSLEQFIQTVKVFVTECFSNLTGGFSYVNKLEQLELKLEKALKFRNMQEKLENVFWFTE